MREEKMANLAQAKASYVMPEDYVGVLQDDFQLACVSIIEDAGDII